MTIFGAHWTPEAILVVGTVILVPIAKKIDRAAIWRRMRRAEDERRLSADADFQQWHALFGDQNVATHGRYQPPWAMIDDAGSGIDTRRLT